MKHHHLKKSFVITIYLLGIICPLFLHAQKTGNIIGVVKDKNTQETLVGVAAALEGTTLSAATDLDGKFKITGIAPGSYNLKFSFIGYQSQTIFNIVVTTGNDNILAVELEPATENLKEVTVTSNTFGKRTETPLSVQSLSAEEIKSNPGGNFDISKVVQALPGVSGTTGSASFRNDIIIRGGAPNENVYYLDGIEVPQINHFATQGSAGGPAGILNVSFIEDVTLSSSSFAAKYDNALSSVLQFKQRNGNPEKFQGNFRLSSTEIAGTLEGPLSKKTTFLASARRSYLQLLFEAIDLPIRPNYWDFQYKVNHQINSKTTLTAIGIGAIDEFNFGVPKNSDPSKEYVLRAFPTINQWTYTVGLNLKRLINKGYYNIALSRNMFNNQLDQFEDAQANDESKRNLKSISQEIENKLRWDVNQFSGKWKFNYGLMAQYVKYNNNSFIRLRKELKDTLGNLIQPGVSFNFNSDIAFFRGGVFGSVSRRFFTDRLTATLGIRTDVNSFTNDGLNPLNAISPRLSLSYALTEKWNINASVGRYTKIPIYTVLGFKDNAGNFVNKDNKYILCDHYVAGLEYLPTSSMRITAEGFYKAYSNYPVSNFDGTSLANQGGNFGAIGNEDVSSTGKGRAYGMELFIQQKLIKNFFATASYTWFVSEFTTAAGNYISSSWDTRHLLSFIVGKKFKKGWEIGLKLRYSGGSPYTPFDTVASRANYIATGNGVLDFSQLNSLTLPAFRQFDFRIDKKFNTKHATFDIYFDVTNALLFRNQSIPNYTFDRNADNSGFKTTDGKALAPDGSNAVPLILKNDDLSVTPALGFIIEF
ncbi:MAG: TonB-dependent receptor [Bacteroidota bacterium]